MSSIFTKIINGDLPCYKVAENDRFFAFLDINPVQEGHTLVVPKNENDYLFDIGDEELQAFMLFAKKVAQAIEKSIPCNRIGVTVIGLEVPHAHIHLIPINGIHDMSFDKAKLKLSSDRMEEIRQSIDQNFE